MSRCSSIVLVVNGRVGFVLAGKTLGSPAILMVSVACPPPAPSVWKLWIGRPQGPGGRAGAAADQGGDAGGDGHLDLLRADEMDVGVNAAGHANLALAGDHLGARPDDQPRVNAALRQRVAGLADGHDAPG